MKSFVDFVNESKVFEAKFNNFTPIEVEAFKQQLDGILKNKEALKEITDNANTYWKQGESKSISKEVKYGNVYLVTFENPFNDGHKLTKAFGKDIKWNWPDPCEPNEEKEIFAIGVGDKFGNVHLATEWTNDDVTIYYNDKGIHLKYSKDDKKWVFDTDKGWYLKRKNYKCYYVGARCNFANNRAMCFPLQQTPVNVKLDRFALLDMSLLSKDLEKEIEKLNIRKEQKRKEDEEKARKQKEYEEWKIKSEKEWKEFKDSIKDYKCIGGPYDTDTYNKAKQYDGEWEEAYVGNNTEYYVNRKNKVYYFIYSNYTQAMGSLD